MRKDLFVIAALAAGAGVPSSLAAQPATQSVGGQQLELAGCGMREMLFMNIYRVRLYLPREDMPASAILQPDTPKLVDLQIVYDGSVPDELPESWRQELKQEVTSRTRRELQDVYSKVQSGDRVTFAYARDAGTKVSVNGETVLTRPEGGVMTALLQNWIGEDPVSENLKNLLLGSCQG